MSRVRDPNSTSSRLNFNAPADWANHVTRVALAHGYPNLTAYIVAAVNGQLKADGCPFQPQSSQPSGQQTKGERLPDAPTKKPSGRPRKRRTA